MNSRWTSVRDNVPEEWGKWQVNFPSWALAIPVGVVLLAETVLFFGYMQYALWIHLLNLLFCLLLPVRRSDTLAFLQPFALLPLFRLVNLGMPIFFELTLMFFPLIYLPLLPAVYIVAKTQNVPIRWNLKGLAIGFVPIVGISALLALGEFLIIEPEPLIPEWSLGWLLVITVIMIGTVGLVEELIFRGILQRRFAEYFGRWASVLFVSILFGAMHSIYGSGIEIIYVTILGIAFGVVYELTDSMGLTAVFHGVLNVFLFAVIPMHGIEGAAAAFQELLPTVLLTALPILL